jgi:hypothetical protein
LVVAAVQDRKIRIEVGYGLESLLTDAASARIIQRATPFLQEERYYDALSQIQFEIESTLSGYEEGDGITRLVWNGRVCGGDGSIHPTLTAWSGCPPTDRVFLFA